MKKRIVTIALLLGTAMGMQAKILRVNNSPNIEAGYNSLSNALLDAAIGDTIYLEPSSQAYGERDAYGFNDMKINKQVTILGPGYYLAENKITEFAAGETFIGGTVRISADNVNISGVIMSNVRIEANNVTLQRCQILNGSSTAVKINTDVNGSVIEQCFVVGDIQGQNYPHNVMVNNNIICGNVLGLERSRIEHNTFGKYNRFGTVRDLKFCTVIENIMENQGKSKNNTSAFVNNFVGDFTSYMEKPDFTLDANYRIKLNAPISTKSSDGGPLGAFGGVLPYVVSGLPDVPVISNVTGPTSVNSYQGLPITVTYKIDK
ncbi:MAG: hypothetical protein K6G31_09195 [Paludibacteraceae bacterium]|nr:hypothetical protein [Paludibacteraceae bacterium]MBR6043141.1 hypothetical protein [Paludibacteraceae bacterium]MCR5569434.1 hypothetical protein [Paludibacteraceae bacterium]